MQTRYDEDHYSTFGTSLSDLDFYSMPQGYEKAKTSVEIILQSFQSALMEFGVLL